MRIKKKKPTDRSVWSVEELRTTQSSWPMEIGLWIPDASFSKIPLNAIAKAQNTVESWYALSYGINFKLPLVVAIVESVAMRGFCAAALLGDKGMNDDQLVDYYQKLTRTRFEEIASKNKLENLFFLEGDDRLVNLSLFDKVPVFDFIIVMKEVK